MEGDKHGQLKKNQLVHFNPLPPHGGRPNGRYYPYPKQHFNPLPPHGGRPLGHEAYSCDIQISIHSLRMEGDHRSNRSNIEHSYFNPLPPHGGRHILLFWFSRQWNFNPLPPHGGRPVKQWAISHRRDFNPLPPHGGRQQERHIEQLSATFQSTPSAWRETFFSSAVRRRENISIHSLRMEGDDGNRITSQTQAHFNPLPPHGGRLFLFRRKTERKHFNPLPPHGGRRPQARQQELNRHISIHSLRMEGDTVTLSRFLIIC